MDAYSDGLLSERFQRLQQIRRSIYRRFKRRPCGSGLALEVAYSAFSEAFNDDALSAKNLACDIAIGWRSIAMDLSHEAIALVRRRLAEHPRDVGVRAIQILERAAGAPLQGDNLHPQL